MSVTCDKSVQGGCSPQRPDILIQCQHWCVIVECDEQEHLLCGNYTASCEVSRMFELAADCSLTAGCAFLRINPDSFVVGDQQVSLTAFNACLMCICKACFVLSACTKVLKQFWMSTHMQVNPDHATRSATIKQALSSLIQSPPQAASVEAIYLNYSNIPAWCVDVGQLFRCSVHEDLQQMSQTEVCGAIDGRRQVDKVPMLVNIWQNAQVV